MAFRGIPETLRLEDFRREILDIESFCNQPPLVTPADVQDSLKAINDLHTQMNRIYTFEIEPSMSLGRTEMNALRSRLFGAMRDSRENALKIAVEWHSRCLELQERLVEAGKLLRKSLLDPLKKKVYPSDDDDE